MKLATICGTAANEFEVADAGARSLIASQPNSTPPTTGRAASACSRSLKQFYRSRNGSGRARFEGRSPVYSSSSIGPKLCS